jgi:zinc finger protein
VTVPELELEVGPHALGGRFSTVEGLLVAMKEQLLAHWGDSASEGTSKRYEEFLSKMDQALAAKLPITIILDDPAGNSFVQVFDLKYFGNIDSKIEILSDLG